MNMEGREKFVSLSEYIPDLMLDIRYYCTYNFIGDRVDGYLAPIALLAQEAADALRGANTLALKRGFRLKVYDAYRPYSAVRHFERWAKDLSDTRMKRYFYPEVEKSELFELGYIASRSGHSRGSAIDLTLFDMQSGKDLDMGGPFDYFGDLSHSDYEGVTQTQFHNRMQLRSIMERNGFQSITTEWWHFGLKDEPFPDTYFEFPVL